MVRLILTKSFTPATLCTVPQRTSQQSEKLLLTLLFINRMELLPRGALSESDFSQRGLQMRYARRVRLYFHFCRQTSMRIFCAFVSAGPFWSFSGASKPLIIRCEHYILQSIITHSLVCSPNLYSIYCQMFTMSGYLALVRHYQTWFLP